MKTLGAILSGAVLIGILSGLLIPTPLNLVVSGAGCIAWAGLMFYLEEKLGWGE